MTDHRHADGAQSRAKEAEAHEAQQTSAGEHATAAEPSPKFVRISEDVVVDVLTGNQVMAARQ